MEKAHFAVSDIAAWNDRLQGKAWLMAILMHLVLNAQYLHIRDALLCHVW